ncbi:MAG: isoprenylcysteine carboxylmethyltransferase family protein [Bacteroidota bacterium]
MMNQYIVLFLLWVGYYTLHSLLASAFIKKQLCFFGKYYRLVYNIIAIIGLVYILFYNAFIPQEWLIKKTNFSNFIGLMFTTYGLFIIRYAFRSYSMKDFLGFAQLSKDFSNEDFKKEGILAYVRHPIYLGSILIFLGYFIFLPNLGNLIIFITTTAYIFIGIVLEEKKLVKIYGDTYRQYSKRTPMIFPKKIKLF